MAAPLFCFGIVADVQYAEKNNVQIDGGMRRYREALQKLRQVVVSWNGQREQLSFALNLGDSVDGNETLAMSMDELERVAIEFDGLHPELPMHHVVGNHCLSVPRQHLLQRLRIPNPGYYSVAPGQGGMRPGWRLVLLDTTEMSFHSGYEAGHPLHDEAVAFELQHPISEHPQMSSWNGGIGAGQMEWLRGQLAAAREAAERVIVACHHPLDNLAAPTTHLAWNYTDIKQLLRSSGCVVLVLSGHFHSGGYSLWEGIHFVTVEAVLEAPENSNAYGIVSVSDATIDITGFGSCTSRTLPIA